MLADRIDAVARDMSLVVRRWFLEQDYAKPSVQEQDWDLVLADWSYIPLLIEYCEEPANPLEKRFITFSALLVLHGSNRGPRNIDWRKELNQKIERIILANRHFAHAACEELGLIEWLVVKRIVGEQFPHDVSQRMREEVKRRLLEPPPHETD